MSMCPAASTRMWPVSILSRMATAVLRALEDNLRRRRAFLPAGKPQDDDAAVPRAFAAQRVRPVDHYPDMLLDTCAMPRRSELTNQPSCCSRRDSFRPTFEHAFLAQQMGVELVEARICSCRTIRSSYRTTQGPQRVDVIYRRIDDDFLDPVAFRSDSMLPAFPG